MGTLQVTAEKHTRNSTVKSRLEPTE